MRLPAGLRRSLDALQDRWARGRGSENAARHGVVLVTSGGLGDTVLLAPLLPRLAELAGTGEPVHVAMRSDAARMGFLFPEGWIVHAVNMARLRTEAPYRWRTRAALAALRPRLVVSTDYKRHPLEDEALVAACGAPEAAAMEPRPWAKYDPALARNRRLYTRLFDSGPPRRDKVLRWTDFANWLTGRNDPPPSLRLPEAGLPAPAALTAPTVVIQPFSAVGRKQPRPDFFRRLIAALPADHAVRIAGTPRDLETAPGYRALLELPNVTFDTATFHDIVPTLRAARLVVSVDTAMMHLSVAVGAPTLCLASAAYVGEIVPYAPEVTPDNVSFLYRSMPCEGCLGDCPYPPEDGMYPCVAALEADAAADRTRAMLEDARGGAAAGPA